MTAASQARDLQIVERHRYGDDSAFEEVYAHHAEMVFNLSWRLSGNRDQASDLTQEVFLRVFRHLAKFRGGASLKTWIYRIALNHCRSELGRTRLPAVSDDEETLGRLPDPRRSPEERAAAEDAGRQVAKALGGLPRRFREAVVLRDLEGLTYLEIAEVTGVRVGTVRSRLARGRERLRRILENT
ncbi:MAG: sigma-70 family RNA polymerase sigma factor [Acidobacteriota bacterium]